MEDEILVVNEFKKQIDTLERRFSDMLNAINESDCGASCMQHLLLLNSGSEEATVIISCKHRVSLFQIRVSGSGNEGIHKCSMMQEAIKKAVQHARAVCKSVLQLNESLRGSDNLAEGVKQLKRRVKSMEATLDSMLANS